MFSSILICFVIRLLTQIVNSEALANTFANKVVPQGRPIVMFFFFTDFITFLYGRTNQFCFLSNKSSFDGGRISSVARVLDFTAGGHSFDPLGCT